MKYRKKPVEVDAYRYVVDPAPGWFRDALERGDVQYFGLTRPPWSYVEIKTLEGWMRAHPGDYIIRGVAGELYPCKADIFRQTYEEVREGESTDENNGAGR